MSSVDERVIPCKDINIGNNVQIIVKNKDSLLEISHTLKAPIFKCEGKYAVVGGGASYEYKE
ncbi:MAG: hypothetical protein ABSD41_03270 [Candidatus Bathyarchaeia archaeon]|jgi:hypothetical protein